MTFRPLIDHHSPPTHKSTPMLAQDCARTCNLLSLDNRNTIKEETFVPVLRCEEGGSGTATKPATRTLCRARDVSASPHNVHDVHQHDNSSMNCRAGGHH